MNALPLPPLTHLLKVLLLLLRVGVVEAHDEFAFEGQLVVLVQQCRFSVADVQVPENINKPKGTHERLKLDLSDMCTSTKHQTESLFHPREYDQKQGAQGYCVEHQRKYLSDLENGRVRIMCGKYN